MTTTMKHALRSAWDWLAEPTLMRRSVASVLVGMTQPAHWEQNARLFALPKADLRQSIQLRRVAKNRPPDQSTPKGPLPIPAMAVYKESPV